MKGSLTGALKFQIPQMGFLQNGYPPRRSCTVTCGLRGGTRKPLWRSRVLSTEAIQAVHALKLAKSNAKLEEVFRVRLSRLLKADIFDTLAELKRQNELELALKVFEFLRKEAWYKLDISLYNDMIQILGKHRSIEMAESLFVELQKEGLKPDTRTFTEMIGAYLQVDMIEKALETYKSLKDSGCIPDKLTFTILIRNLEKAGKEELAAALKKECADHLEDPEKFLEEVEQKHPKKRLLNLI